MTSEERHQARYERRKARRDARRKEKLALYGDYDKIITRKTLSKAAKDATKGVKYKASVKRFMLRRLINVNRIHHKLEDMQDVRKGFICFNLMDRGKMRKIMSVHFSERVPQKSLNKNALVPIFTGSIIYDNGASQKGKGTSFAIKRMTEMLCNYYRYYGNEGYALVIDFEDYFGNIDHELAKELIAYYFDDSRIIWLACQFIDAYYEHKVKEARKNGTDPALEEAKGLGLGSETNQTIAITYPNKVDHFIKEVLRRKWYVRYMDDSVILGNSKEELAECLNQIREKCAERKININEQKTYITKLSHGFTFLKTQFFLTETGRVIKKPCHESIVRERRKMKRQLSLVQAGEMTIEECEDSIVSWKGSMKRRDARRSVHEMLCLFNSLFGTHIDVWGRKGKEVKRHG